MCIRDSLEGVLDLFLKNVKIFGYFVDLIVELLMAGTHVIFKFGDLIANLLFDG